MNINIYYNPLKGETIEDAEDLKTDIDNYIDGYTIDVINVIDNSKPKRQE